MTDSPMNKDNYTFRDTKGRQWDVTITLLEARKIKNSDYSAYTDIGVIDLLNPSEEAKNTLGLNDSVMVALVWTIIQDQLAGHDISSDDEGEAEFCSAIDGNTLQVMKSKLEDSICAFCPMMRIVFATSKTIREKATEMAPQALENVMGAMEELMDAQLEKVKIELLEGSMSKTVGSTSG